MVRLNRWLPVLVFWLAGMAFFGCQSQRTPSTQPRIQQGVLDLSQWSFAKQGAVSLDGTWAMHWHRLLTPQDIRLQTHSPQWQNVPHQWSQLRIKKKALPGEGYATYQLRVLLPKKHQLYGLQLGYQRTAYKLWLNNQVLATNGRVAAQPESYRPEYRPQVKEFFAQQRTATLTLQIANFSHPQGGFRHSIRLGTAQQINSQRDSHLLLEVLLMGCLFAMALYHLILFFYRRGEFPLLCLSLSCIFMGFLQLSTDSILLMKMLPDLPWEVLIRVECTSYYIQLPFFYLYLQHVYPHDFPRWIGRIVIWLAGIATVLTLLLPYQIGFHLLRGYQLYSLFYIVVVAWLLWIALRKKRELAWLLFWGGMFLLFAGLNDILRAWGVLQTPSISPVALFTFIFCQSVLLAIRFQRMAEELYARSERLKRYLSQVSLDRQEREKGELESVASYVPIDRRLALSTNTELPKTSEGVVLFADISGFTPMTESLTQELGRERGVEELIRQINRVYESLIAEVHQYGGCVIYFSGDAITCWYPAAATFVMAPEQRAIHSAFAMQEAMHPFASIQTSAGTKLSLHIKIAMVRGSVRRMLVGDPAIVLMEAIVGTALDQLAQGESLAQPGEILLDENTAQENVHLLSVREWRDTNGLRFGVLDTLTSAPEPSPWPAILAETWNDQQCKPWVLNTIYNKVLDGQSSYLSELRTVSALFLKFHGIDYENDPKAEEKLDPFVRWVQRILESYQGSLIQLTTGDKGSYLYAVFGTPIHAPNDAAQAVLAAMRLQQRPKELAGITQVQMGLARGAMRAGPYGSPLRRTYGAVGPQTNLAARLMVAAQEHMLCDATIYEAAKDVLDFEALEPIRVKGKEESVAIYRPILPKRWDQDLLDHLDTGLQLTLKVASLLGDHVDHDLLQTVHPVPGEREKILQHIQALRGMRLLIPAHNAPTRTSTFLDPVLQEVAYSSMLFAQRRQLHRDVARAIEKQHRSNLKPHYDRLIHHWQRAENTNKTTHYLELAGELAQSQGRPQEAVKLFNQALELESQASVLSQETYRDLMGKA